MKSTHRATGELGETLVELLITVAILGISFVALLAGLATAIGSTATHRGQANADVVILSAADAVKSQTYAACTSTSTPSYNPTTGVAVPAGWSPLSSYVTVTGVQGWNGTSWSPCSSLSADNKLQLVTVRVVTPGNPSTTETVDVVKRNPA